MHEEMSQSILEYVNEGSQVIFVIIHLLRAEHSVLWIVDQSNISMVYDPSNQDASSVRRQPKKSNQIKSNKNEIKIKSNKNKIK